MPSNGTADEGLSPKISQGQFQLQHQECTTEEMRQREKVSASSAGRLKLFYKEWIQVTSNLVLLNWIKSYTLPFLGRPVQTCPPITFGVYEDDSLIYNELEHLKSIGAVVKCSPVQGQLISRIFLADKPNRKKRFILNLKNLNTYVEAPHFKMEDSRTAIRLFHHGMFAATLDLKEAYFLVPIDVSNRKYLRFSFREVLYEFTCLSFGLTSAFTKIMKPVVKYLRSNDVVCVNYIDDFLILGSSERECNRSVQVTLDILQTLGFLINWEKSVLRPSTRCKFLGFFFDSIKMSIELPANKRALILCWIDYLPQILEN